MSQPKFHRITDRNHSIYGLQKHTSFEAAFSVASDGSLCLCGRVLDSEHREIFCSSDIRDITLEKYQDWNPAKDLADFIEAIELETISIETTYFQTPYLEMSFEVKGPIAGPDILAMSITMSLNFRILESYQWQDSGHIHIAMLCHRKDLLAFAKGLQADVVTLQTEDYHSK